MVPRSRLGHQPDPRGHVEAAAWLPLATPTLRRFPTFAILAWWAAILESTRREKSARWEGVSMVRDITERKRVEKDLNESHLKLRNLAEHMLEKMLGMISLAGQTIQRVQRISTELRPRILDDLGLTAAIEWLVGDFSRSTGIRCKTAVQ